METWSEYCLFFGIALALVVTTGVCLVGLFPGSVMESLAHQHISRGASGGSGGIAVGKLVTEVGAARFERGIADGAGSGTVCKPTDNESGKQSFRVRRSGLHAYQLDSYCRIFRPHILSSRFGLGIGERERNGGPERSA